MSGGVLERFLPDEEATARLGEDLALALRKGDVLALSGDLGTGKTTLARSLIRTLANDPFHEVPSPTYTLVQSYETSPPVHHYDLYRLSSEGELAELGFDEAISEGAALVEWPEKAEGAFPDNLVRIELFHEGEGRRVRISGSDAPFSRIERSLAIRDFLDSSGYQGARRTPFQGDASARSYERLRQDGGPERLLMNAPALVLGPPVKNGRPYAEIAHTAQNVSAFVGIDHALQQAGVTVPEIIAADLEQGFLLLENLGSGRFLDEQGKPVAERYAAAAELLAMIHAQEWQTDIEFAPGHFHKIPPFDRGALMIEVELLLEWYIPAVTGEVADKHLREEFAAIWNELFDRLESKEQSIVLRDFHSPNIIWRPEHENHERLGIIDFQDAMLGPAAYDVASLAMDARVDIPREIEATTLAAYRQARHAAGVFDEQAFEEAYSIMAAQRNSKILGIFVRLHRRDGKAQYLAHLPRIRDYVRRALQHPALSSLADLYERHGLLEERKL